ncbi:MAG TPA: SusC/RagA family TonB-linked outer membrane protein [Gemmatimonadaceae bacterium]
MALGRRLLLALVVGMLWAVRSSAQIPVPPTGTVTGRIVDAATQEPVSDVSVVVEGTRRGAVSGPDGTFTIVGVPAGSQTIRARRIGFSAPLQIVVVPTSGSVSVVFPLQRQAVSLEDVVTTGYGTQRRVAITGSIATVDASQANVGATVNVNQMIEGRAAGVQITTNSGEPGAGAQITVRGGSSISASNEPLYVIDGVPINNVETESPGISPSAATPALPRSPLTLLNPADIASISILKDAAAAIYGTRAANGVVLIETKKGTGGGPSIQYDAYVGTSSAPRHLDIVTGDQYRAYVDQEVAAGVFTPAQRASLGTSNTNWEQAVLHNGATYNHNLSFSGGSASTQYRASLNYMNQEGIVISSGFKRTQARVNGTHQALDGRLRLGLNLTGSNVQNDYIPYENSGGFLGGLFINTIQFNPTKPLTVTDATGAVHYYETSCASVVSPTTCASTAQDDKNPVALANQIQSFGNSNRVLGNGSAEFDLATPLTARVLVGVDRTDGHRSDYFPLASPAGAGTGGDARQASRTNLAKTLQTVLTFHPDLSGNSSFDMLGGYEYNDYSLTEFIAESQGFLTDALGFNGLSTGSKLITPGSNLEQSRLVGFFTKANYSFKDTYFLTGSWRKDGSSRFGVGNKWAAFPAISGSVRLSQLSAIPKGPFSELRLRAGWGRLGNPGVPPYASLIRLSADANSRYVFGDQAVVGFVPVNNANPDLKWETTDQSNIGLDYGFGNNRFSGTLEYYVKNTHDLLLRVPVPQPAVVSDRLQNIGKMSNKGVEFSLDAQVLNRATSNWSAGVVFSADRNKVIDLGTTPFYITGIMSGQGQSGAPSQRILPGQPLGTFYGPQYAGVCDQTTCGAGPDGVAGNADDPTKGQQLFNHYTVDANGVLTLSPNKTATPGGNDFVILGNANPKYTLGLRTNGNIGKFDFSALINSQHGQKVLNETALVYATKSNAKNNKGFLASALTDGVGPLEPSIFSDRFIEDGSFWRLQNVTVGYTFDLPTFTGTARGTRVYLSGDNLLLSTSYTGYDPEVYTDAGLASRGIDYLHYPRARTFTGGFRVAF